MASDSKYILLKINDKETTTNERKILHTPTDRNNWSKSKTNCYAYLPVSVSADGKKIFPTGSADAVGTGELCSKAKAKKEHESTIFGRIEGLFKAVVKLPKSILIAAKGFAEIPSIVGSGVCAIMDSDAVQTAVQVSNVVPNPYSTAAAPTVNTINSLCAGPKPVVLSKQTSFTYPKGSIATFDKDQGAFKIAIPPSAGYKLFKEAGIEKSVPPTAVQVSQYQYNKLTRPWYSRTPFLIGGGAVLVTAAGAGIYTMVKDDSKQIRS